MNASKRFVVASVVAVLAATAFGSFSRVAAQTVDAPPPVLVVLDKDAIDYGPPPHFLPADAVDSSVATVGARDELGYFQNHLHAQVILTSAQNGSDGWFAVRSAPASWSTDVDSNDGIENFVLAGPGLGSPDDNGDRESQLQTVPNVVPVRADGLNLLVGRTVCAVVYANDIVSSNGTANLSGPTLGRIAFKVVSVIPVDGGAPNVQIEILEGHEVCSEGVTPFADAPDAQ